LYRLKLNADLLTVPTIGFNVETIEHAGLSLSVWDIGGQNKIRKLWTHYYINTDAIIFVVDSTDRERLMEAKEELQKALAANGLRNACLLVYANKQDLPNAMQPQLMAEYLELTSDMKRPWKIMPSVAKTGEGLYEGLDWISSNLPSDTQGGSSA
jgi:ADP-ribosylation factor protein 1